MNSERSFLHDLSSPLTGVQLTLESAIMVLEADKPEGREECLRMLSACTEQMSRTMDLVRARREGLNGEGNV